MTGMITRSYTALMLVACLLVAYTPPAPAMNGQQSEIFNSYTVGGDITAIIVTIPGATGKSVHLYSIDAVCHKGAATITIDDGLIQVFDSLVGVQQPLRQFRWDVPFTTSSGSAMTITLGACSVVPDIGAFGEMSIQADRH